jgi:hypothetical protein
MASFDPNWTVPEISLLALFDPNRTVPGTLPVTSVGANGNDPHTLRDYESTFDLSGPDNDFPGFGP